MKAILRAVLKIQLVYGNKWNKENVIRIFLDITLQLILFIALHRQPAHFQVQSDNQ